METDLCVRVESVIERVSLGNAIVKHRILNNYATIYSTVKNRFILDSDLAVSSFTFLNILS